MIEFTKGDMFAIPVDARVNTVNCVGAMGAGVALAFKNRYPDMFKEYKEACKNGIVRPGAMYIWKNLMGDWIINFPTKRHWKESSRYEDVDAGLDDLRHYLQEQKPASLALPALGCGHGGLDWSRVSSMIKDKLGDLDTHIFVFEPADSRNVGQAIKNELSDEQVQNLSELGFKSVNLPHQYTNEVLSTSSFIKGDESLLNNHWVALLPSKAPAERELMALDAIAQQMSLTKKTIVIALVYANRTTEKIAELFLNHGISIVLILPFCPLTHKSIGCTLTNERNVPFSIISLAKLNQRWSHTLLKQSMKFLKTRAISALFSALSPDELLKGNTRFFSSSFYIRYECHSTNLIDIFAEKGMRPIGRCSETKKPNITDLLQIDKSYFAVTASQLREIAMAIDLSINPYETVDVAIPNHLKGLFW